MTKVVCFDCSKTILKKNLKSCNDNVFRCKSCQQKKYQKTISVEKKKQYHQNSFSRRRDWGLKKNYSISTEEYEKLWENQNKKCSICSREQFPKEKKFPVDHNHRTGQIRGILCHNCNRALGSFGDSLDSIGRIVDYLSGSYLSWDRYFIEQAKNIARKSKDPSTKVGAVLVKNKRIISSGYNGLPSKLADHEYRYTDRSIKYELIIHAEINAILQSLGKESTENATLYVVPFPPCSKCAMAIIQTGITRVVFWKKEEIPDRWTESMKISKEAFEEAGVKLEEFLE